MDYRRIRSPAAFAHAYWERVYTNTPALNLHNRTCAVTANELTELCRPGAYLADNLYSMLRQLLRQPANRVDAPQHVISNETYRRITNQLRHYTPHYINPHLGPSSLNNDGNRSEMIMLLLFEDGQWGLLFRYLFMAQWIQEHAASRDTSSSVSPLHQGTAWVAVDYLENPPRPHDPIYEIA